MVGLIGSSLYGQNQAMGQLTKSGPVAGRFVVKLTPKARAESLSQSLSSSLTIKPLSKVAVSSDLAHGGDWAIIYTITLNDSMIALDQLRSMIGEENIEYIEPEYHLEFYDLPSDPLYAKQWFLNNTGQDYTGVMQFSGPGNDFQELRSGLPGIDVGYLSQLNTPPLDTSTILVAVIDGGVDLTHPEMAGRIWRNPDEISFNGLDDDHNGLIDDTLGWDFSGDIPDILNIEGDNDPSDFDGHGTHIAGIIAANRDGVGIVGIAPHVDILPVKTRPNATTTIGAAGIVYAVNSGARVINISWGTPFESLILKEAIDFARANGVFIAIAAGNSGDNERVYPASFDSSFAVAASNSSGYLTTFSTYGAQIDLTAPGLDILSLRAAGTDLFGEFGEPGVHIVHGLGEDSLYYLANGTSMAAPMVAGAAALILSYRPDLQLNELENILRFGGDDIIDPLNQGDTYLGPDTIGGYGLLNIDNSLNLIIHGGLHIVHPLPHQRYTQPIQIRFISLGGYAGEWEIDYSVTPGSWIPLASGQALPLDSVATLFDPVDVNGKVTLRLTDSNGHETFASFYYISQSEFNFTSPVATEEFRFSMEIKGSVFGEEYDSLSIYYRDATLTETRVAGSSREFFDESIYIWNISGVSPGDFDLIVRGYYDLIIKETIIPISILSSFAMGWPQPITGRGGMSAVAGDLDGDGFKEIFVGTINGLNAFNYDGQPLDGFPVLRDTSCRTIPAIYDIDRDGEDEIIITSEAGLHAFNHDGSAVTGWPKLVPNSTTNSGFPIVTVTRLGATADSALAFITNRSEIFAYEFNGDSYFYSLEGWYSSLSPLKATPWYYGGHNLSSADLTGDNRIEIALGYSGGLVNSGVSLLDGRTGQPAFSRAESQVIASHHVYGTLLADLNNDGLPEIVAYAANDNDDLTVTILTKGVEPLPGWPVTIEGSAGWLSSPLAVADLDLDGSPEVIVTLHEFDIASVYVFKIDGSPYLSRDGRPPGEIFFEAVTLGPPIVADLVGDAHPEIVIRSGYILPGTGPERIYIIDHNGLPIPGWPVATSTSPSAIFSTPFAPLIDDIDGDGLVELILVGEGNQLFIWDFTASSNNGKNIGRLYYDNLNSARYFGPGGGN